VAFEKVPPGEEGGASCRTFSVYRGCPVAAVRRKNVKGAEAIAKKRMRRGDRLGSHRYADHPGQRPKQRNDPLLLRGGGDRYRPGNGDENREELDEED